MYKLVVQTKRRSDLSKEDFERYYETGHKDLVKFIAHHIVRYTRSYPVDDFSDILGQYHHAGSGERRSYDVLTEVWVKDKEGVRELYRLLQQPDAMAQIKEDEPKFQDLDSKVVAICKEYETDLSAYR